MKALYDRIRQQLTTALRALSEQYAQEQTQQSAQVDTLGRQVAHPSVPRSAAERGIGFGLVAAPGRRTGTGRRLLEAWENRPFAGSPKS